MKKIYFGGEHYFTISDLFRKKQFDINKYLKDKYPGKYFSHTGGGFHSIHTIIEDIGFKKDDEILMPSYLCPSILIPFEQKKVNYTFYKVELNLNIDVDDILLKINNKTKAIFIINYFGFTYDDKIRNKLKQIKENGMIIIEDLVQSFFSKHEVIGNYAFNSYRKYLPLDGSAIISEKPIQCEFDFYFTKYNFYKTIGQILRYLSIHAPIFDLSNLFLLCFKKANENYHKNHSVGMNKLSKYLLSKQKVTDIIQNRRELFSIVSKEFKDTAIFTKLGANDVPLGLPIVIKNREELRTKLMEYNVYCPVHWRIDLFSGNEFNDTIKLSKTILTIPLSCNINELPCLLKRLMKANEDLS